WPFIGTFDEVARKHLFEQPPTVREKGLDIPVPVEEALQRALCKDPSGRFACIQDFADALQAASGPASSTRAQQDPPVTKQSRSPLPFIAHDTGNSPASL